MAKPALCPICNAELPVNAPLGLCPACLLTPCMDGVSLSLPYSGGASIAPRWREESSHRGGFEALKTKIGDLPSVVLLDTETDSETPVVRPSSPEMPAERGRYQLLGEIGHGGMGAVFKGRDPDLGRDLAVKVLLEEHQNVPDLVRRFVEEAQIGGQLQHPGIVPVYELGSFTDRRPYFTMKLVKGRTLATMMKERANTAHDLPRFLAIFEQICQTMAYAHSRGVIHRDLKPSNVMVGPFGEVQVMDWGLAKVLPRDGVEPDIIAPPAPMTVVAPVRGRGESDFSESGSVLGTPAYMAPEQARGEVESIDRRVDVFALGSILCEILTGVPAFAGGSSAEIIRMARRADTAGALYRLEHCGADHELLALARECLAAVASQRPDDAGVVAARVTAYLAGVQDRLREAELSRATESARAHEAEVKASAERQARRLTAALAATVLLAILVGGAGWRGIELQKIGRAQDVTKKVNDALTEATELFGRAKGAAVGELGPWELAANAANNARDRLEAGVQPELRKKVEELAALVTVERERAMDAAQAEERDRRLMDRLVDIRSAQADDRSGGGTDQAYADAFREAGLDVAALSVEEAAKRIRDRRGELPTNLAAAVDDWAAVRRDRQKNRVGAAKLSEIATAADPDPWRVDLRRALDLPEGAARRDALQRLVKAAPVETLGPISLDLLGRALKDAGDPIQAEQVLRRAEQRHPQDVWINYDLARSLEKLAKRDEAIRYYTAARSIRPETAHELAHTLGYKGARDEEIAILEDLKRIRPASGRHLGCLGRALREQGRLPQAEAILDAAVAANREAVLKRPDDAYAHYSLGFALFMQGKTDDAINEYKEAIHIQPNDAAFHDNLCEALGQRGNIEEAFAEHRTAIGLKPDFANAHNTLGHILSQVKQDFRAAATEFRKAIDLQSDVAVYHNNLGLALQQLGEFDDAITEYREVSRLRPNYADAHLGLGEIFEFQGKRENAIAEFRVACGLKPDSADAHNYLAWALMKKPDCNAQEMSEAREHILMAVDKIPKDASFLTTLALTEYRAGLLSEAIAAAERSISLTKGVDASNWYILAMALWKRGEKEDARKRLEKAVALTKVDPENGELRQFSAEAAGLLSQPVPGATSASVPAVTRPPGAH